MPWAAAAAIGGAVIAADASNNAVSSAESQNAQNMAAQERWNTTQDPFSAGGNRAKYVSPLNDLMAGGYAGIENDPMYQWMRKQGVDQTQRGMSKTGGLGSGAEMIALQNQGYGLGMDFFNQQYNRLADLSGASRGGGSAATGMDASTMYDIQMNAGKNDAAAFGGVMRGLSSIFGNGQGGSTYGSGGTDPNNTMYSNGTYSGDNNLI